MQDTYQLKMFLRSQLVKESGTFEVLWQVHMAPHVKEEINFLTNAWLWIEIQQWQHIQHVLVSFIRLPPL